jgi:hypothetical protein
MKQAPLRPTYESTILQIWCFSSSPHSSGGTAFELQYERLRRSVKSSLLVPIGPSEISRRTLLIRIRRVKNGSGPVTVACSCSHNFTRIPAGPYCDTFPLLLHLGAESTSRLPALDCLFGVFRLHQGREAILQASPESHIPRDDDVFQPEREIKDVVFQVVSVDDLAWSSELEHARSE